MENDQAQYHTGRDVFAELKAGELYRTMGFKEIAMIYGDTEKSYRKTTLLINRLRHQEKEGTPFRTLQENTEKEGAALLDHIEEKSKSILLENGFTEDGMHNGDNEEYENNQPDVLVEEIVSNTLKKCQQHCKFPEELFNNPVPYEDPKKTINIAIDDVNVKKQEEHRDKGIKTNERKRKYVHNTVAHISKEDSSYTLNGYGINSVLSFITAFILNNGLTGNRFQFFTDGHTTLNETIIKCFSWYHNMGIILDWYHLEKKCKERLSMAMKGYKIRNELLEQLRPLIWHGMTDMAIVLIKNIEMSSIKDMKSIEKLIAYFERNKPYIPNYAARKELGLCNSSAIGEKMNDLVVSERQKHNGMSWSKDGSVTLATITSLKRNKEHKRWFENKSIDFKLAA
jgi:hypothetical protein